MSPFINYYLLLTLFCMFYLQTTSEVRLTLKMKPREMTRRKAKKEERRNEKKKRTPTYENNKN